LAKELPKPVAFGLIGVAVAITGGAGYYFFSPRPVPPPTGATGPGAMMNMGGPGMDMSKIDSSKIPDNLRPPGMRSVRPGMGGPGMGGPGMGGPGMGGPGGGAPGMGGPGMGGRMGGPGGMDPMTMAKMKMAKGGAAASGSMPDASELPMAGKMNHGMAPAGGKVVPPPTAGTKIVTPESQPDPNKSKSDEKH